MSHRPEHMAERPRVGLLGLGRMGSVLASRLLAAEFEVIGHDPLPESSQTFASQGGIIAPSPRSVADQAPIIIACLPSVEISLDVAAEVSQGTALRHYVEMSTIGRTAICRIEAILSKAQIGIVDAPISGGVRIAAEGNAAIVAAGRTASIQATLGVLNAISQNVLLAGSTAGDAQTCKLVNNAISFAAFLVSCEAIAVGVKAGIDPDILLRYVNAGSGRNSATVSKIPTAVLSRSFNAGGAVGGALKDIELYLQLAREAGMGNHLVDVVARQWRTAATRLGDHVDISHIARLFEEELQVEIAPRSNGPVPDRSSP